MWSDNLTRIRRFIRDPNSNIWTDAFLLRSFNDDQRDFIESTNPIEKIEAIRIPPEYGMTYLHDWEFTFCADKQFQALRYHHQSDMVVCNLWEGQSLGVSLALEVDTGEHFIHPWEGYLILTTSDIPPMWFPVDFDSTRYIAWDRDPINYITPKVLMSDNMSWRSQTGDPESYYRKDALSNEFYLYPRPSTVDWNDPEPPMIYDSVYTYLYTWELSDGHVVTNDYRITTIDGDFNCVFSWETDYTVETDTSYSYIVTSRADVDAVELYGQVLFVTGETGDEDGTIIDIPEYLVNGELGIATDAIDIDNNLLLIYSAKSTDIQGPDDDSSIPKWIQKYIEYGAISRSFKANTDGNIESLADYWNWRKELGVEVLKRYRWQRLADRDFRLTSKVGEAVRNRRGPRLPSTYQVTYP